MLSLVEFPDEILLKIAECLDKYDVDCLMRVCRRILNLFVYEYHQYDERGRTLLIIAASLGHHQLVTALLLAGIDTAHEDNFGRTALLCAAGSGHDSVVQLLLAVGTQKAEPENELAVELSALKKFDRQSTNLVGQTPLSAASRNGHDLVVRTLLADLDVSLNHQDVSGRTPLTWASAQGHVATVQALLSHEGVNADHKSLDGDTPLCLAAENGHVEVVKLLLAHAGTDRDSVGRGGKTPLLLAAQMWRVEVARCLLAAGADPTLKDTHGLSSVDLAKRRDENLPRSRSEPARRSDQSAVIRLLNSAITVREPKTPAFRRCLALWFSLALLLFSRC
ncbi:Ankyrin repeat domain-containing protein 50 [Beauveria bassiana]|nr:Ankyrin repeat domain-containing protein 50 [Beauveria bassiana]